MRVKQLYIIDALNFLFRSYYAIKGMSNKRGESTNALFGFIRSVHKLLKDFSPHLLAVVFDGPDNKKKRSELYAEYKSHRKAMPEDLVPQIDHARAWCALAGLPMLSISGVEADDTMGSIALWAERQGFDTFLCSSDKDLAQLVTDHVFVVSAHKDNLLIDKEKVKEIYGVRPEQMVDYLAIVGDASDNIPGLEGFGPKTATLLLQEFGTLDNLLAHPERVAGEKKQKAIIEGREVALLSRQLAQIHTDVEFPQEEAFFEVKKTELPPLEAFYEEMGFSSLLKELRASMPLPTSTCDRVRDPKALEELMEKLEQASEICLAASQEENSIALALDEKKVWRVPLEDFALEKLAELFSDPQKRFYAHDAKKMLHLLAHHKLPLPALSFDTLLASYLITPESHQHALGFLVPEYLHYNLGEGLAEEALATMRLKALFEPLIEKMDLAPVLQKIELPLIPVLLKMERRGIFVDPKKLGELSKELALQIEELEKGVYELAGLNFNLNSPKQLAALLFETLGLKPPKKTKTGFSTDASVLESLQDKHPIIPKILTYRTLEKLRSTYLDALPLAINPETHRIHCTFNQYTAATGRLSCQDPNLQNIPVRSEVGKKIRSAFRPESDTLRFLSADYSQIELRLLAHLSEDPALLKAFEAQEDVHAYTAALVFNVPLDQVTKEMRHKAKAVNFGILYGQQAFGLSQGLKIDFKEAEKLILHYFQTYSRVKEYLEECKERARGLGKATTLTGRQRPIPEITSSNPQLRAAAERLAVNTPLQGTAADLIKLAMIEIDGVLEKHSAHMLLQIHDELIFECEEEAIPALSSEVKKIMEGVFQLKVPLVVDISVGKNWGEC